MSLLVYSHKNQVMSFAITTVGWIFSMTSMGLAEWRLWYVDNSSAFPTGLATVGMWKVCTYHHANYYKTHMKCHRYAYSDAYLPLDVRVAQNLLLASSILGLLGKVLIVLGLGNVYLGHLQKNATWTLFIASGALNITAGVALAVTVIWNYHAVMSREGIDFPAAFNIPFRPDRQEPGSAVPVAVLAAFMMVLSGLLSLSYQLPPDSQVYPEAAEA
ncbi:PREDICTED: claudin-34 [Miniopterus natalensis]|uniref:claudin-34 n=1 Tax=Miniopterus natalensis TaxID=291302 RepID=UPI0007A6D5E3|nr:PREDICTED: claudin-34 [Miniopterus natalensis]XP_016063060.1 PREDICTED: claudin-34 [Miniopterus natalensis]